MDNKIEAKAVLIANIFSQEFLFKIPFYQRPFSWTFDDFDVLFEDLYDAMNNGEEEYFLGSILIQETGEERQYEVVDGQQRLTALTIMLAVIRDTTNNPELTKSINSWIYEEGDNFKRIPAAMRVTPWEDLVEKFDKYIYSNSGTRKYIEDFNNDLIKFKDKKDPIYHIYEAITTFENKLLKIDGLEKIEGLEKFVEYLLNNVYMVYIKTSDRNSASKLFNVLNARGQPLSTFDLLKSENLGAIEDKDSQKKAFESIRDIEEDIGINELEKIIGYIRTVKAKEKAKTSIYNEYQQIFKSGLLERGNEFIDYLKKITEIYYYKVLEGEINGTDEEKNRYSIIIGLMNRFIPFSDWIPPLLAFYAKFYPNYNPDDYILNFILKLEKKVLIEWMAGFSPTERITSLNKIIKLIESTDNPQEVIDNFYKKDEFKKGIKSRTLNFNKKEEISSIIVEKLNDNQFYTIYGGKLARYILLRIDMELWDLNAFSGYSGMITVEHILPQTPSKNSDWIKKFTENERNEWTNKLGNLVLLSGRKNSKARNYDFKKKKDVYFEKKSAAFQVTQKIRKYEDWNIENLIKRHDDLIKEIERIFS